RQGLRELGYTEDRTILIEWRWTEGKAERARELAAGLVRLQPNVLVTSAPQPSAAAKAATAAIPIVFIAVADPVGAGLVAALARPGGNVTGLATLVGPGFTGKLIELLKEALPQVSRVAVLINPTNAIHQQIVANELPEAAERLRLTLFTVEARAAEALEGAFETAVRSRDGAILALGGPLVFAPPAGSRAGALRGPGPSSGWGIRSSSSSGHGSPSWRRSIVCPQCISSARASRPAVWWVMGPVSTLSGGVRPVTWTRSSRAPSPATCPLSNPPSSSSSSTSRPRRLSDSRSRRRS